MVVHLPQNDAVPLQKKQCRQTIKMNLKRAMHVHIYRPPATYDKLVAEENTYDGTYYSFSVKRAL
jgi:hypothetical protein